MKPISFSNLCKERRGRILSVPLSSCVGGARKSHPKPAMGFPLGRRVGAGRGEGIRKN